MLMRSKNRLARKGYFWLGFGLLCAFFAQEIYRALWPWLTQWQTDSVYKQLSGLALILFLGHQWRCSISRNLGCFVCSNSLLSRHKWLGALAPLFFYAHAQHLGYAYLQVLSWAFFALVFTGLFNGEMLPFRQSWFRPIWLLSHIGLATALLFLIGYHVVISYVYE